MERIWTIIETAPAMTHIPGFHKLLELFLDDKLENISTPFEPPETLYFCG